MVASYVLVARVVELCVDADLDDVLAELLPRLVRTLVHLYDPDMHNKRR